MSHYSIVCIQYNTILTALLKFTYHKVRLFQVYNSMIFSKFSYAIITTIWL